MTYTECKDFTKYFLKNYKSVKALKEIGYFILTVLLFIVMGVVMAILLNYSWWNTIPIILFIIVFLYVSMIWIDWKYPKGV
jgi:hypothetical protein